MRHANPDANRARLVILVAPLVAKIVFLKGALMACLNRNSRRLCFVCQPMDE